MKFWRLRPKSANSDTWIADTASDDVGQALTARLAEGWTPDEPVQFEVFHRGKNLGDMLHTGGLFLNVASEGFCRVLEDMGATGWVSVPVEIRYKNGKELPGYRLVVTTGRCDDFRLERDIGEERVPFEPSGWDGSDLFYFEAMSIGFLITDRVKLALEKAGMQRLEFERPMR